MKNNTFLIYDDGVRKFLCTFTNCQRGDQNVVYRIRTDGGKIYIGNAGLEGILGRLRQYPHEDSRVWNEIFKTTSHCTISVLARGIVNTDERYLTENLFIYKAALSALSDNGYKGNYSPQQVNMLMEKTANTLINKRLDRVCDLSYMLSKKAI